MLRTSRLLTPFFALFALSGLYRPLSAQELLPPHPEVVPAQVVVPQVGALHHAGHAGIHLEAVRAEVAITEASARTRLTLSLRNPRRRPTEVQVLVPVPDGAVVDEFAFEGGAAEAAIEVLQRDQARTIYRSIVSRMKDPALLEFAGYRMLRSSVFPVAAGAVMRVRIGYHNLVEIDGTRHDYLLPRSESLERRVPWQVKVELRAAAPISMVYSPTHDLAVERQGPQRLRAASRGGLFDTPGPFRLAWVVDRPGVHATFYAYPDPASGGGYFLMLAGAPPRAEGVKPRPRELTLVLDRSGSMAGGKLDQVKAAALQVIEGLADGESFNILDYSTTVERMAPHPVVRSAESVQRARAYLAALRPGGGTNIHDALVEALQQPAPRAHLPIVLFLTDGLPTVGRTAERTITEAVERGNPHRRRIFTFGVGDDVNVPLLDRISDRARGLTTYVAPQEDVEVSVAQVFRRLEGPVLSDLTLRTVDAEGRPVASKLHDLEPQAVPDLYQGEPLVLLGRYRGQGPVHLRIGGRDASGAERELDFHFSLDKATTRNAFVPRLWAGRRIAYLVDQIRQLAAAQPGQAFPNTSTLQGDPRFTELRDQILRLSTEFGVLSEYTSFLARDGVRLDEWQSLASAVGDNLHRRAQLQRTGREAVSQGRNFNKRKLAQQIDYDNRYFDEQNEEVGVANVQQINDRAFFKRGQLWLDTKAVVEGNGFEPDREIAFGSEAYWTLLEELVRDRRQGLLSLSGDILLEHGGQRVLVRAPISGEATQEEEE